jgi:hypothetical protein
MPFQIFFQAGKSVFFIIGADAGEGVRNCFKTLIVSRIRGVLIGPLLKGAKTGNSCRRDQKKNDVAVGRKKNPENRGKGFRDQILRSIS